MEVDVGLFHRVLVAVDGSDFSRKAAKVAVELCRIFGAELIALHVVQQPPYMFAAAGVPPSALKRFLKTLGTRGKNTLMKLWSWLGKRV
uniref:Universal stress protein n=1 Tax=Caldiarchaeum subterraneum TaxID=311458 RepID=A0A7C5U535_CALS0